MITGDVIGSLNVIGRHFIFNSRGMSIVIPMDVYDSPVEMVIILPLGGVEKDSVRIVCKDGILVVSAKRSKPLLKESLVPVQEQCFRGSFEKKINVPSNTAFDRIFSELSAENILTIVVPKIVVPEEILVKKE